MDNESGHLPTLRDPSPPAQNPSCHRISNRYTKLLEIALTHSKQTTATQSNRYKFRGSFPSFGRLVEEPAMRQCGRAALRENLIVNLGKSASCSFNVKKLARELLALDCAAAGFLLVLHRFENCAGQRLRVLRRHQPAGFDVANQIGKPAHIRRHNR